MAFYLRKLNSRAHWLEDHTKGLAELQKDPDDVSLWRIDDSKSNLDRVLAALATNRQASSTIDYRLLSDADLAHFGAKLQKTNGDTKDNHANTTWHHSLIGLTDAEREELARLIFQAPEEPRRQAHAVRQLLKSGLADQHFRKQDLHPRVQKEIEKESS